MSDPEIRARRKLDRRDRKTRRQEFRENREPLPKDVPLRDDPPPKRPD